MRKTPSTQRPTPDVEISAEIATSNIEHRAANILWRVLGFIVGAIFIYAGVIKVRDPIGFAGDIDNYKILPWAIGLGLAFYLPWLEIACGLALILHRLYGGGLTVLIALVSIFIAATVATKIRGLDITCGCFGHVSQHWSFSGHLALDLAILGALLALWFSNRSVKLL